MLLRPFLNVATSCASYLFGCGTHAKLAVVDPHTDLVDDYRAFDLFPISGRQPDHDRPPLRPSRPRWPRSRDPAIHLLDAFADSVAANVHPVDAAWTSEVSTAVHSDNGKTS
jgi:hypothetical protein